MAQHPRQRPHQHNDRATCPTSPPIAHAGQTARRPRLLWIRWGQVLRRAGTPIGGREGGRSRGPRSVSRPVPWSGAAHGVAAVAWSGRPGSAAEGVEERRAPSGRTPAIPVQEIRRSGDRAPCQMPPKKRCQRAHKVTGDVREIGRVRHGSEGRHLRDCDPRTAGGAAARARRVMGCGW